MKTLGLTIDMNVVRQVLISTLLGGLVGLGFAFWRGNNIAVFLCAVGAGSVAIGRIRNQQRKQSEQVR